MSRSINYLGERRNEERTKRKTTESFHSKYSSEAYEKKIIIDEEN